MTSSSSLKTFIVIPAYNEAHSIQRVLEGLKHAGYPSILVVDDGSTDETYDLAYKEGVYVARHLLNSGLGGALGTGIQGALMLGADIIVTFDADGQHAVEDIPDLIAPIEKGEADVTIGSRLLDHRGMPFRRVMMNWVANVVTFLLFGIWVTDSQSGLRAFSRDAARLLRIRTRHMEVSSEIIREIGTHRFRYKEVPIQAIYTDYSLSKGQNFFLGMKTLVKLILHRLTH